MPSPSSIRDGRIPLNCLRKPFKEWGLKGCGEFTAKGIYAFDEVVQALLRKCAELDVPILIHTQSGGGVEITAADTTTRNVAHPIHIKKIQAAYPDLKIILAHAGYDRWWEVAAQIAKGSPNSYLELSSWNYQLSSPAELIPKIACMRDTVGADHLLFASDHQPGRRFCGDRSTLPQWVDFFNKLPEAAAEYGYEFSEEEVALILGGNAKRLLGL